MLDKDYSKKDCHLWVSDFKCSMTVEDFTGSYVCCTSSRCIGGDV